MTFKKLYLAVALFSLTWSMSMAQSDMKTVVVVFDGLRPDYINQEMMPNLHKLRNQGSYGADNHSVFPTVTRVNSSSYATASYPYTHGILGNSVHIPSLGNDQVYNTGNMSELLTIDSLSGGKLLTSISVGEVLAGQAKKMFVFSSGSTGQAYLQNHTVNGAIIHPEFILPKDFAPVVKAQLGAIGAEKFANHAWVTDAFLTYGLAADGPQISSVWYSEPDAAQHGTGIGSPQSIAAVGFMDAQLGRILEALQQEGLKGKVNLIVSADHGFITYKGENTLGDFLIEEGFKKDRESNDIIMAGGALFIKNRTPEKITAIVAKLQEQPWVGPIFTAPKGKNSSEGIVPGTLSFDMVHWNHSERTADILVTHNWNDDVNEFGYKGIQTSKVPIAAGHGGISFHEIRTPLVLIGPAFKTGYVSELPTSFIDIMPTVLALQGIETPTEMNGRVMREFFVATDLASLPKVKRETISSKTATASGTYEGSVQISTFDGYRYLDFGKASRTNK